VFFNITTPKFAAQAIRKAYDIGWKPVHYLNNVSTQVGSVLKPAGLEKSVGLISTAYIKDPTDKQWENDAAIEAWRAFMKKYYPEGSLIDNSNVYGYTVAATLHQVLKQCGDNLTRENVMRQAASMKGFSVDTLLPGVSISTSSQDFAPIQSVQLMRFNGSQWERFGEVLTSGR
jgi:branched-chain amino acid transport system substrate-binding protein